MVVIVLISCNNVRVLYRTCTPTSITKESAFENFSRSNRTRFLLIFFSKKNLENPSLRFRFATAWLNQISHAAGWKKWIQLFLLGPRYFRPVISHVFSTQSFARLDVIFCTDHSFVFSIKIAYSSSVLKIPKHRISCQDYNVTKSNDFSFPIIPTSLLTYNSNAKAARSI